MRLSENFLRLAIFDRPFNPQLTGMKLLGEIGIGRLARVDFFCTLGLVCGSIRCMDLFSQRVIFVVVVGMKPSTCLGQSLSSVKVMIFQWRG